MGPSQQTASTSKPRQRPWNARVRTGCLTCRKRRIKCDEQKPYCQHCVVHGRQCLGASYGLTSTISIKENINHVYRSPPMTVLFSSSEDMSDLCRMMPLLERSMLAASTPDTSVEVGIALSAGKMYHYLNRLPCRAGYEMCLDSAVKCIATALSERLAAGKSPLIRSEKLPTRSLGLYTIALRALRYALDDPNRCQRPEVLCAAQLLGIFESLVQDRPHAPSPHVLGAGELIRHRGVANFNSPFEYNLLVAQIPAILAQSFSGYQRPFLAQPEWMAVLESCAQSGDSVANKKVVQMYQYHLKACDVDLSIASYLDMDDYDSAMHQALLLRSREAVACLSKWRRRYHIRDLLQSDYDVECTEEEESVACIADTHTMTSSRFHVSLGDVGGVLLERETQQIAQAIMRRHDLSGQMPADTHVLVAVTTARAILATAEDYSDFAASSDTMLAEGIQPMIPNHVHERFMKLCGFSR